MGDHVLAAAPLDSVDLAKVTVDRVNRHECTPAAGGSNLNLCLDVERALGAAGRPDYGFETELIVDLIVGIRATPTYTATPRSAIRVVSSCSICQTLRSPADDGFAYSTTAGFANPDFAPSTA